MKRRMAIDKELPPEFVRARRDAYMAMQDQYKRGEGPHPNSKECREKLRAEFPDPPELWEKYTKLYRVPPVGISEEDWDAHLAREEAPQRAQEAASEPQESVDPSTPEGREKLLRQRLALLVVQNPGLRGRSVDELKEMLCAVDLGHWSEIKRGYQNADIHWEWSGLAQEARRAAILAPREHGKSEVFSVNNAAWHSIYRPGFWTYIFCNSGDQGEKILSRTVSAIAQVQPELVEKAKVMHAKEIVLGNDARITVRGSGSAVRGAHPDLIIGDDVQDESNTSTQMQREKLRQWWFGTVGGMAHPGTQRVVTQGRKAVMKDFPATRIVIVGTPFHALDLLMSCKENEMYEFRLYSAAVPDVEETR